MQLATMPHRLPALVAAPLAFAVLAGCAVAAPVQNISRLAVSPDGRWLAFVAEPRVE